MQLDVISTLREKGLIIDGDLGAFQRVSLPCGYPPFYTSLCAKVAFFAYILGPALVYSNVAGETYGLDDLHADRLLTESLIGAGFPPIGRPTTGSYDRICFDTNSGRDWASPIVLMDHECILTRSRIPKPTLIAVSFGDLMAAHHTSIKVAFDDSHLV